jgi:hypothetical protein
MLNALSVFDRNIASARHLTSLFDYLSQKVAGPLSFDDLLRSQVVYSVSALDKLMHDLVRIGMVEAYTGVRRPTPKFSAEAISLQLHSALVGATVPPKEVLFEQEVIRKLGYIAFQDPDKISDGLSLIWDEKQKWDKIAAQMGEPASTVRTRLKLIVARRNAIVHEADMSPLTTIKTPITKTECSEITDFLHVCGRAITNLVK